MLDIGWTELLVIGIVALIVVGPKDLPIMFRKLGQITGKMRSMAREFQRALDSAADEAGVRDVARDLKDVTSGKSLGLDGVQDAVKDLRSIDPRAAVRPKPGEAWPRDPETPARPRPETGPATRKLAEKQAAARAEAAAARPATDAAAAPAEGSTPAGPGKGDA
ncbi:Sec-independent protein translocase protein TatB [Plastorhodobacter daqingensis]|uniref:Sec-independent protein translocase protein TatB n=1 Tax=Plastorhodobacter daqingensis TaxID=1387281 RepID=A0ABW2UF86_9RHOB